MTRTASVRAHRRVSPKGRPHGVRQHNRNVQKKVPFSIRGHDTILNRSPAERNMDVVFLTLTRSDAQLAHRIDVMRTQQKQAYEFKNLRGFMRSKAMEDDTIRARLLKHDVSLNTGRRRLRGGDLPNSMFPPKELKRGAQVELEHTSSHATAQRIARDHLAEDPHYYTKLKTIHPN